MVQLKLVLLAWGLRKMEEELGEAPSSKEEDEVEVVQLVGVDLRQGSGEAPARWRSFNGWRSGGASPWLGVEREKFLSEWDEGESTGCSGGRGRVADAWGP